MSDLVSSSTTTEKGVPGPLKDLFDILLSGSNGVELLAKKRPDYLRWVGEIAREGNPRMLTELGHVVKTRFADIGKSKLFSVMRAMARTMPESTANVLFRYIFGGSGTGTWLATLTKKDNREEIERASNILWRIIELAPAEAVGKTFGELLAACAQAYPPENRMN